MIGQESLRNLRWRWYSSNKLLSPIIKYYIEYDVAEFSFLKHIQSDVKPVSQVRRAIELFDNQSARVLDDGWC